MVKIKLKNVSKSYGENELFKNISFDIMEREVIGIVGKNGSGKSTLANIIYGKENFDSGNVEYFFEDLQMGYLKQSSEYEEKDIKKIIESNDNAKNFFKLSSELGIKNVTNRCEIKASEISGGEKTKLVLSTIWSNKYNVLILDEPTNHMDIKGVEWLVQNIKKYNGIVIIISHNRNFLDLVATSILEIKDGNIEKFKGNFTEYKKEKEHRYKTELLKYENQKKEEIKIDKQIEKFKNWAEKGHRESKTSGLEMGVKAGLKEKNRVRAKKRDKQVKSKIKRLESLKNNEIEKPKEDETVRFKFNDNSKKINKNQNIVYAENLCKKYSDSVIFNNSNFYIKRSDKIGLVGANGTGKTTLINMILKNINKSSGEFFVNDKIKVGYLNQSLENDFGEQTTLNMLNQFNKDKQTYARTALANIGLKEDVLRKKIKTLSLGQNVRIKLVFLILNEVDVLILDEPTNHLDLNTIEQLEKAVKNFKGTIIVASHDKYLLYEVTNSLLVFEGGKIKRFDIGYKDYYEKKQKENFKSKNKTNVNNKNDKQQKMLLELEQSKIVSELGRSNISNVDYEKLDKRYKEIIKELKSLK